MQFSAGPFKGRIPKIADYLLPSGNGLIAKNLRLGSGKFTPLNGTTDVIPCSKAGTILTIFLYKESGADYWFQWTTDVDCVMGPINEDTHHRAYFTGDGVPQVTSDLTALTGSGGKYPYNAYTLGIPKPGGAITLDKAAVADGGVYPESTAQVTTYAYRFVTSWGEQGALSIASAIVEIGSEETDGHKEPVRLSGFDVTITGDYDIDGIDIFRANFAQSPQWQYVATIPFGTTTYDDMVEDEALGEVLPAEEYLQPPGSMQGIIAIHNAMLAGFNDKEVLISYEELPHAWPGEYRFVVNDKVVGLGHVGNTIIVLTEGTPYVIQGQNPLHMVKTKLDINQACSSKRGIADVGNGVIYPSPDGLVFVGAGNTDLVTANIIDKETWAAEYAPETILAEVYDGKYIAFYDNGTVQAGFIYDPRSGDWVDIDLYATALFNDQLTDTLYMVINHEIVTWDTGSPLIGIFKSGKFITKKLANMAHGRVFAEDYPVTFRLYGDNALRHTRTVANKNPFTMPSGYKANSWYIELEGGGNVEMAEIAETIEELRNVD